MPDTSSLGDSQGVVGLLCTLILGVLSWWNLRKGQRDTHELDADAAELNRERFDAETNQRIIGTLREEIARLVAARAADEERHDRDVDRMQTRFETERRVCAREIRHMHEELLAAAAAVRGEVERAAAGDAAHRGETHLQVEHGQDEQ
jgi:hypothetical protein